MKREREKQKQERSERARRALFRDNALVLSSQLHSAAIIFPALFPSSLLPSSIVPRKNTFAHNETDRVRTTRAIRQAHAPYRQPAEHQRRSISLQQQLLSRRKPPPLLLLGIIIYDVARERSLLLSAGIVRAYCARPGCRNALQLSQFALMCLLLRVRCSQSARLNFPPLQQRARDIAFLRPTPRNATAWKSLAKLRKCEPFFPVYSCGKANHLQMLSHKYYIFTS
jgi:hypothetical protein